MPELTMAPLADATRPSRLHPALAVHLPSTDHLAVESRRLEAPLCYWVTYRDGDQRSTFKAFFAEDAFKRYAAQLALYYPQRIGLLDHPRGGFAFVPELNGILWRFPFDPVMPGLARCLEPAWPAEALAVDAADLAVETVRYSAEVRVLFAYRAGGEALAYGKTGPKGLAELLHQVMEGLWTSPARHAGRLRLAEPLGYDAEAGLVLQAAVPGRPHGRDRNQASFLRLVEHAAPAIAAVHSADLPIGHARGAEGLLRRLERALPDLALAAPPLYASLRRLVAQLEARTGRSRPGALVPSHGDFKYDQFLEHQGQYTLIDFEMFCQAEPWLDVGSFCAYVAASSPRDWREGAAAEVLRQAFLAGYAQATGQPIDYERLSLYESAMLALRGLSQASSRRGAWLVRGSALLDLALERLLDPEARWRSSLDERLLTKLLSIWPGWPVTLSTLCALHVL